MQAADYGGPEEELGKCYAQRTLLKSEVLPEDVANAVFVLPYLSCGDHRPDRNSSRDEGT